MKYNFDECVDRRGTYSRKWSVQGMFEMAEYADEKSIPLWVADMDFKAPDIVKKQLSKRIEHGIFGYPMADNRYYEAIKFWNRRRGFEIESDWILTLSGVVPALNLAVRALTFPGDGVIIQTPVYPQFKNCVINNGRVLADNPLVKKDDGYEINFQELEILAKNPKNKLMIICNPHNPVGRVWSREDLEKISEICLRNDVTLVSDEIHSDLVLFENRYTSIGAISDKILKKSVICTSLSKTFNLAALKTAHVFIADNEIRNRFKRELLQGGEMPFPSLFGIVGTEAAYSSEGKKWLNELIPYLENNYTFMKKFLEKKLPRAKLEKCEATYLAWIDLSNIGLSSEEIKRRLEREAKVVIDGGEIFGEVGRGYIRLNFACPKSLLEESLVRICEALKK